MARKQIKRYKWTEILYTRTNRKSLNATHIHKRELECGPIPNVMAALSNTDGVLLDPEAAAVSRHKPP